MNKQQKRTKRIRGKTNAVTSRDFRLSINRSGKNIYAQIIDQKTQKTVAAASSLKLKGKKTEQAVKVGENLATSAKAKKIDTVYFDRGHYKYHGRAKALADATRKQGLKF